MSSRPSYPQRLKDLEGSRPDPGEPARGLPLAPEERARADRAGRRLHSALRGLLGALPETARNASGMARHLGVDRTTCQRAVFVASRPYPGLGLFERLPGARALRALGRAAAGARPPASAEALETLESAVAHHQQVVRALGGSLARLIRRIALDADGATLQPHGSPADDARLRLFEAAAELTGRSSDCWVAVYVYRPALDDPERVEILRAHGLVGHTAHPGAIPLVAQNFATRDERDARTAPSRFTDLDADGSSVVLEEFSSSPPPLVTTRQPDQFLVQAVDTPAHADGEPVDILLASRSTLPHPARRDPALEEVWGLVNFPCRHLLLDVYLHPDLARRSVASLDAHLWGPDFERQLDARWQTRTNETTPLQLLGSGVRTAPPTAFPRLPDLTARLFERGGIDPSAYVGYRCDVPYPLWRVGYCITFDFAEPSD